MFGCNFETIYSLILCTDWAPPPLWQAVALDEAGAEDEGGVDRWEQTLVLHGDCLQLDR